MCGKVPTPLTSSNETKLYLNRAEVLWSSRSSTLFLGVHSSRVAVYSLSLPSTAAPTLETVFSHAASVAQPVVFTIWSTMPILVQPAIKPFARAAVLLSSNTLLALEVDATSTSAREIVFRAAPDRPSAVRALAFLPERGPRGTTLLKEMLLCVVHREEGPGAPIVFATCYAIPEPTPGAAAAPVRIDSLGEAATPWIIHCLEPATSVAATIAPGTVRALGRSGGVLFADSRMVRVFKEDAEALNIPWPDQTVPSAPPKAAVCVEDALWLVFFRDGSAPALVHLDARTVRRLDRGDLLLAPDAAYVRRDRLLSLCHTGPSLLAELKLPEGRTGRVRLLGLPSGPVHFCALGRDGATEVCGSGAAPYGTLSKGTLCGGAVEVLDPRVAVEGVARSFYLGLQGGGAGHDRRHLWLLSTEAATHALQVDTADLAHHHPRLSAMEALSPAPSAAISSAADLGFTAEEATLVARQLSSTSAGPSTFFQVTAARVTVARLPNARLQSFELSAALGGAALVADASVGLTPVHVACAARSKAAGWMLDRGRDGEVVCHLAWAFVLDAEPACIAVLGAENSKVAVGSWGDNQVRVWETMSGKAKLEASSASLPEQPRSLASQSGTKGVDILASGAEGSIFVLRAATEEKARLQLVQKISIPGVRISPQLFALGDKGTLAFESGAHLLKRAPDGSLHCMPVAGPTLATAGSASLFAGVDGPTVSWSTLDGRIRFGPVDPLPGTRWSMLHVGDNPKQAVHLSESRCWAVLLHAIEGDQQQSICFVDDRSWVEIHRVQLEPRHHVHALGRMDSVDPEEGLASSECLVLGSSFFRDEGEAVGLVHEQAVISFVSVSRTGQPGTQAETFAASLLGLVSCPLPPSSFAQVPHAMAPQRKEPEPEPVPEAHASPAAPLPLDFTGWQSFLPERATLLVGTGLGLLMYEIALDPKNVGLRKAQTAAIAALESAWPLPPLKEIVREMEAGEGTETTQLSSVPLEETFPQQRIRARLVAATALQTPSCVRHIAFCGRDVVTWDVRGSVHVCHLRTGPHGGPVLAPVAFGDRILCGASSAEGKTQGAAETTTTSLRTTWGDVLTLRRDLTQERLVSEQWGRIMSRAFEAGMPVGQVQISAGAFHLLPGPLYGTGERKLEAILQVLSLDEPPQKAADVAKAANEKRWVESTF